jgi:hypothetical protein
VSVGTAHAYISCHDCCKAMQNQFISEKTGYINLYNDEKFIGQNMMVFLGVVHTSYTYVYMVIDLNTDQT